MANEKTVKAKKASSKKVKTEAVDEVKKTSIQNYGFCCSCRSHRNHPSCCRLTGQYVGRKQEACEKYKV